MPRTRTPDPAPALPVDGATLVVEAPTAEAAIAKVHDQLGGDARIVEARRVLRGGIGGFFSREVVELHAGPGGATATAPAAVATPEGATAVADLEALAPAEVAEVAAPSSVDDVLADAIAAARRAGGIAGPEPEAATSPAARLLAGDEATELDFATFLRRQMDDTLEADVRPAPVGDDASAPAWLASALAPPSGGGVVDPLADRPAPRRVDAATLLREREALTTAADIGQVPATLAPSSPDMEGAAETIAAQLTTDEVASAEAVEQQHAGVLTEPGRVDEPGPAWSAAALIGLGLPATLVRGLAVEGPGDDVAWTAALAGAIRPLCRPLPSGRSVLAGPRARALAGHLGVPVVATGQPLRSRAETIAATVGGAASRAWLDKARRTRWVHLVVGGRGWRDLLGSEPLAVSWASTEDLPEALRLASELGLVLGSGPVPGGTRRARPLDVALAIRDLLPENGGAA